MINRIKKQPLLIRLFITYIALGITAFALLCLVYLLPISRIQANVNASIPLLKSEGMSHHVTSDEAGAFSQFLCNFKSTQLDNFVDSEMLLIASNDSQRKFFQAALLGEHYEVDGVPFYALINEGEAYPADYARYWHGYLLYLKPLLFITNYANIRVIIGIVETLLLIATLLLLFKNKHLELALPIIAMWIFLGPIAMSKSLQYFDIYFVTMIEILCILILAPKYKSDRNTWIIHFFVAGCATSFFDLLTYPLVSFAIPSALLVYLYCNSFKDSLLASIKSGISWSLGYLMFWAGKWIGGSLILKANIVSDAATSIALRTGGSVYDEKISYLSVITRNITAKPGQLLIALIVALAAFIICLVASKKTSSANVRMSSQTYIYILYSILPFVWYFATKNHSGEHFFFTFRDFSITAFSLWLFATSEISKIYQNNLHK